MSNARWQRLDRLFVDALQHPPEQRDAFVSEQCNDDETLRADVLSLLSAADGSGEFMTASAFDRLANAVGDEGWTVAPGVQVGVYTITERLGAGSSGEVWRARDHRFDRDVAIKILLPHLSEDAGRLRRFADEVRAIGSLSHPNILAVYDVGNHHGLPYLVSECLSGQSLRTRLDAGAVPAPEAITIVIGIARGLAAAHKHGIVHRDLKPENVFLDDNATVKILDFGVAKLLRGDDREHTESATIAGFIVGTAGYMAPEQVRGQAIDARADLFALGVVMYELLTGKAPFSRDSAVETLHAVVTADPAGVADVNPAVPAELADIVMRLLAKDLDARFQSATDLIWALERMAKDRTTASRHAAARPAAGASASRRRVAVWLAAAGLAAAVVVAVAWIAQNASGQASIGTAVTRFTWSLPPGTSLASAPAVSPDGRSVAFIGARDRANRLFVRSLDAFDAVEIEGTAGARLPFWSPDSRWIGFYMRRRVMKVSITGGAPMTISDYSGAVSVRTEMGAAWGADNVIVYGPGFNPPSLFKVPASGGAPAIVTSLARGQTPHRFPSFLPDGKHFVYQARGATEYRGLFVGGVDGEPAGDPLIEVDSTAVYVPDASNSRNGILLYANSGRLTAQSFDPWQRTLIGAPQPVGIDVGRGTLFHPETFGAASHLLAYSGQLPYGGQIKTVAEGGGEPTVFFDRQEQQWPRISPDGTRIAWLLIDRMQGADIYVEDLTRHTRTRVTTAPERDITHVWSPDGQQLAYRPDVEDRKRLSIVAADGSGKSRDLVCPRANCEPTDWSSDGRELIVNAYEGGNADVWALAVSEGGHTRPLLESRFNERDARLSPDRRWIAYVSDEAGAPQVSVRSLAGSPRRYTVSPESGDQVVWARDGRAVYYVNQRGRIVKVPVREAGDALVFGAPAEMPVTVGSGHANTQYDISPDGRIYYLDPTPMPAPTDIRIVLNWQRLLR